MGRYKKISGTGQTDGRETEIIYAGLKRRVMAAAIDIVIITFSILLLLGNKVVMNEDVLLIMKKIDEVGSSAAQNTMSDEEILSLRAQYTTALFSQMFKNSMLQIIMAFFVIMPFWYYKSATPGKMIYSMRIVDARTLGRPSITQLLVRFLSYFISLIVIFMGIIWIGFDERKQGWHDKIARTAVIHTKNLDSEEEKSKKFKRDTYLVIAFITGFLIFKIFFSSK